MDELLDLELLDDLEDLVADLEDVTEELLDEEDAIGVPSPHSLLNLIWLICLSSARILSFCSLTTSLTSFIVIRGWSVVVACN